MHALRLIIMTPGTLVLLRSLPSASHAPSQQLCKEGIANCRPGHRASKRLNDFSNHKATEGRWNSGFRLSVRRSHTKLRGRMLQTKLLIFQIMNKCTFNK